jgi:biopolymer transport protein ExbD
MAGRTELSDDGIISAINVTPLVDITLVLLIVFMVTAKMIVTQSLPLDLPKAASGMIVPTSFSSPWMI